MSSEETPQKKPDVISTEDSRRFFEDGAYRLRKPHHGRRIAPSGLDTDSMDFRGVRAALTVTGALPKERDTEGKRLPTDPATAKEIFDLGLTAIRQAGSLPLDDRFVEGYQRWADAVVRDEARLAQNAQDGSLAEHSTS